MLRMLAPLRRTALTIPRRSPPTRVIPALCIATSVPVPIAMPTSASLKAGASLMPSPAIATCSPAAPSFLRDATFPAGSISASNASRPSCPATTPAVRRLSPVSMTIFKPSAWSSRTASSGGGLDRVGDGEDAGGLAVDADEHHGLTLFLEFRGRAF